MVACQIGAGSAGLARTIPSVSTLPALPPPSSCACSMEQPMRTAPTSLSIASENGRRRSPMRGEWRSAAMPLSAQTTTPPHHVSLRSSQAWRRRSTSMRAPRCARRRPGRRHRRVSPYRQSDRALVERRTLTHRRAYSQQRAQCHRRRHRCHLPSNRPGGGARCRKVGHRL